MKKTANTKATALSFPLADPVEISNLGLKTDFTEISEVRKNTLGTLYVGKTKAQPWKISYEHLPNELLKIEDEDLNKSQESKKGKVLKKAKTAQKVKVAA